ncbi:hypothetical protein B0H19DRAFT_1269745 [Mycena capillaripes]|nr:hypothetical protein B0H19DRAFT_1269745 [Mycena capillaripes]
MRRIASVFARKDKDRDRDREPKADLKRANTLRPLAPAPTPVPSFGSDPLSSASSTGSASLSLQTPDDDPVLTRTPTTKSKSWTAWLGKKSGTIKRGRPADERSPVDQLWVEPVPDWRPKQPPPILHAPPPGSKSPPPGPKSSPPVLDVDIDSDEDASSSESDDDESVSPPHSAPALFPPITPTSVAQSRKNLEILIQNSLVPPLDPSPFSHLAGARMYPRSSNPPYSLPARHTMQTAMHKTLLLRRLHQSDVSTLTVAQQLDRSILAFASLPPPTPVDPPSPLWFNDRVLPTTMMLSPSSAGLRRWMVRPCFEERIAVWIPVNGVVTSQPVVSSSLAAVAELEYSAALDAMIGFGVPPVEPSPVAPVPTSQPQLTVATTAAVRNTPFQAVPSPLRNSALKSAPSKSPVSEAPPLASADPPAPSPTAAPTTSRVRFVEEDKEDVIPLGYALRLKKRREEKAKFLREEQERRAFEEERAKQEVERLKREQERRQWEEEKWAWEKEKRAMEEERKQRIYAEEVAAARLRREHQRAGGGYGSSASNADLLVSSSSTTSLREERNKHDESGRYSRALHDQHGQRRQASEPAVPQHSSTPSSSPHTSSPGSSRPPSIGGHQAGTLPKSSRPPSVHTSSSEDARQQPNSTSTGKRSSMASLPGKSSGFDWSSTYPTWSASNPSLQIPPMPPVPMYAMDMPLLPPTPPFMLHQYPRPRSQNSNGGSSPSGSPSRSRLPSNASSERVNVPQQQHRQSSSSRRGSSSSSSRPDVSHQRRSSDDARRASLPPPKPSSMRSQSSTPLSRGRPPIPSSYQAPPLPSPWTAPPLTTSYSQQQLSPAAIIHGYGQRPPPKSNRRQTTIS